VAKKRDLPFERLLAMFVYLNDKETARSYTDKKHITDVYNLIHDKVNDKCRFRPPKYLLNMFFAEGIHSSADIPLLINGYNELAACAREILLKESINLLERTLNGRTTEE